MITLYYIILQYTTLYYIILYCIILYYIYYIVYVYVLLYYNTHKKRVKSSTIGGCIVLDPLEAELRLRERQHREALLVALALRCLAGDGELPETPGAEPADWAVPSCVIEMVCGDLKRSGGYIQEDDIEYRFMQSIHACYA